MNIENALKIDGWMRPSELEWLATRAAQHKLICEVGSWMGRSTRAIADNTPGVVYAVDTWKGSDTPTINAILKGKAENWLIEQFRSNIGWALMSWPEYRVRPVKMTSLDAAKFLGVDHKLRFDMIFIDAAHDYDSAKADILAWRPLLAEGGLLCGHDYGDWPTVTKAVNELIPNVGTMNGSIWEAK